MMEFSLDNLDRTIDAETREAIAELILMWARYDSLMSQWVIFEFGMDTDSGPILLGNMDTRTRLDRLKRLYEHHSLKRSAKVIDLVQKKHQANAEIRNTVAHTLCAGRWKSDPSMLVFAPVKPFKGSVGQMLVQHVPLQALRDSAKFAEEAGDKLAPITEALVARQSRRMSEPLEFPDFPDPSPHTKRRNKSRQPRPTRTR
jgi:hypothetical protein